MRMLLVAVALFAATPVLAQDAALGTWKTQPDDNGNFGHVRIYDCGGAVCGQLVRAFDGSGSEVPSDEVGKRILWDMAPQGGGRYGGGKIYAPDRGKTYTSRMELSGDALEVSGCVLGICRGQTWTRISR